MERKLIALAVSAAITATFAAGTASAAQKTVTIQGDKWDEPVLIYPTDASGSGFANIGELKVDVKDGIVIDSVTFKNTNPDSEKLRVGYLKHFGKKAVVNTLEIKAGTADRPTVATLQFWGKEKDETGKSFEGKKVVMRDMSVFRVANTNYFRGNYAGKSVKDSGRGRYALALERGREARLLTLRSARPGGATDQAARRVPFLKRVMSLGLRSSLEAAGLFVCGEARGKAFGEATWTSRARTGDEKDTDKGADSGPQIRRFAGVVREYAGRRHQGERIGFRS